MIKWFRHKYVVPQFFVLGMHRTGHCAVANWLLHQCVVEPKQGCIPDIGTRASREHAKQVLDEIKDGDPFVCGCQRLSVISANNELQNFLILTDFRNHFSYRKILVLRDFCNWAASAMMMEKKYGANQLSLSEEDVNRYITHCQEYYNPNSEYYVILFNDWFEDFEYRKEVCEDLDLKLTDNALSFIPSNGNGSSFTGFHFQHRAQKMSVNDRWELLKDSNEYVSCVRQYELAYEISSDIFGPIGEP